MPDFYGGGCPAAYGEALEDRNGCSEGLPADGGESLSVRRKGERTEFCAQSARVREGTKQD